MNGNDPERHEAAQGGAVHRLLRFCLENKLVVLLLVAFVIAWGVMVAPFAWNIGGLPRDPVPVDAIPDIGENQQIVFTEWPGRSPQDVEDQVTYPLTVSLLGIPGVKTIRSSSMFGFSSIYVIFKEDIEFYWSRTRILEKLNSLPAGTLPEAVQPALGPDATALGQVFWYTLEGRDPAGNPAGGWDLQQLRTVQDWYVRYALTAVDGVAEVASAGGFVQEYQVDVDPDAMRAYRVTLDQVFDAVRKSNIDVGARTIELNSVEYVIRGLGFVKNTRDLEQTVVAVNDNVPIYLENVGRVTLGPAMRRGALDKSGAEAVGGVVVARYGANPLAVIDRVKAKIAEIAPGLPSKTLEDGTKSRVTIVPFYDRSGLIHETLGTLNTALTDEVLITIIVVLVMVMHLRSSLLISGMLPLAVLLCFIAMKYFGVDANVVALSGIAIAIGTIVDMGIVLCENVLKHVEAADPKERKLEVVLRGASEVGSAVLTAVLTTVVSFLPVFTMEASEGKLFKPLAFTKTFALLASIVIALTVLPALMHMLLAARARAGSMRRAAGIGAMAGAIALVLLGAPWWAAAIVLAIGAYHAVEGRLSLRVRSGVLAAMNFVIAAVVAVLLASHWMPLGPESDWENIVFVVLVIGGILGVFKLFERIYEPLLRWTLAHKGVFLLVPAFLVLLGLMIWQGYAALDTFVVVALCVLLAAACGQMLVSGLRRRRFALAAAAPLLFAAGVLFVLTAHAKLPAAAADVARELDVALDFGFATWDHAVPASVVFTAFGVLATLGLALLLVEACLALWQRGWPITTAAFSAAGLASVVGLGYVLAVKVPSEIAFPQHSWRVLARHEFPGLGKEFMPRLDEGSFLLMPVTQPHASIGEAMDVLRKQDMAIRAIPEVDSVVGKIGRADSSLDPAPISMIETVINYKPEYRIDEQGHRLRFRYDEEAGAFARDAQGELIPDPDGRPYRQWRPAIRTPDDIWEAIAEAATVPGATMASKLQPIATRIVMLQTGMRSDFGVKVFGPDLETIEHVGLQIEKILQQVPSIRKETVFADRVIGKPYLEIDIDRDKVARYGLSIRKVQDVIEVAVGGRRITTTVEGRERYPVRVRYMRELRDRIDQLGRILVPAHDGAQIPLDQLAHIRYRPGPQNIKSEDTFLTSYVIFDKKDGYAEVDVVEDAKRRLEAKIASGELELPPGVSYRFAGMYESQIRAERKLAVVLPLALFLIFLILWFQFRRVTTTMLVFTGVFVAWGGGFLMLWLYGEPWFLDFEVFGRNVRELFQMRTFHLSVAVWVGFLALFGIATDDGVVMSTYLKQTFDREKPQGTAAIREATVQAGKRRVRPCLMTTATTILALLPVLTSTGKGSDIMVPMAIPSVGGMTIELVTLFVVPVLYCAIEEWRSRLAGRRAPELEAT